MWANAQRDGRPAEYRRRHVFNAAKFDSQPLLPCSNAAKTHKNSSGDEIANVNFFYNIAHVEASAYAH